MGRIGAQWVWIVMLIVTGLGGSGCGSREDAGAPGEQSADKAQGQDPRLFQLDSAYRELDTRLDLLSIDSMSVPQPRRAAYGRLLESARTVRDNTKVRLHELRVSPRAVTPEIWEAMRERTHMSLDSLRRLLISADSARAPAGADR